MDIIRIQKCMYIIVNITTIIIITVWRARSAYL